MKRASLSHPRLSWPNIFSCLQSRHYNASVYNIFNGGARGVMVIVVGNEHGDTSSNPGRDWLHFT